MSGLKHPGPLPREVIALALRHAMPAIAPDLAARQLYDLAERQGGRAWKSIGWLGSRDPLLRGSWLRYAYGQPLAVGRLRCLDRAAGVFYVVIDDDLALRHDGRVLLFGTRKRAEHAASLAAASRRAQRLCGVIAALLCKPESDIVEADLPEFDAARSAFVGAMKLASADWGDRPIAVPITLDETTTPKGREILAEILAVALNPPAAAMTVQ